MHVDPVRRHEYEQYLLGGARQGLEDWREVIERWRSSERTYVLWGYNPPPMPLHLAHLLTYLRRVGLMDRDAAEQVLMILREYSKLRSLLGDDFAERRAETRGRRLPLFINIFSLPVLAAIIENLEATGDADKNVLDWLREELGLAVEPVFAHAEWGAMNRAIVRSCGLWYAAKMAPEHPAADDWRQMAEVIADDNLEHWEIEDASTYHPVWMFYLIWYLELRGDVDRLKSSPFFRWYLEYFLQLMAPHGTIPDFGDGEWRSGWFRWVSVYEAAASLFDDSRYKWVAARIFRSCAQGQTQEKPHPAEIASTLILAHRWCDDSLGAECPDFQSREVLDDAIGKKIVLRNGADPASTYLLLNYREEHDCGWLDRQYLRDTITVEEEKMHHGHSDENSIVMLMSGGSVLLHDAGYRSGLPSGRYGAYRADYFHNRLVVRNEAIDRDQDLYEFIRSSGSYRPVRTWKIDFGKLEKVDYARTRLLDQRQGYIWDRIVIFLREDEEFFVIDGFLPQREDFYTVSCLWHLQTISTREEDFVVGGYDHLSGEKLPTDRRLLVRFLGNWSGRRRGVFEMERHYGRELCFHETAAGSYLAGRWIAFVTHLAPVRPDEDWRERYGAGRLLPTSWADGAVGLEYVGKDKRKHAFLLKLDLDRERLAENVRPRYTEQSGAVRAGNLETDAHFAHIWEEEGGVGYSASVFTFLRWNARTLVEVPAGTFGLQPDGSPDREARAKWRAWNGRVLL